MDIARLFVLTMELYLFLRRESHTADIQLDYRTNELFFDYSWDGNLSSTWEKELYFFFSDKLALQLIAVLMLNACVNLDIQENCFEASQCQKDSSAQSQFFSLSTKSDISALFI